MSVNFYKQSASMLGFDPHAYVTAATIKMPAVHVVPVWIPPVPPEPVLETIELADILSGSEAVMEMQAHKVTAQGTPLATALVGPVGLERDCGDPVGVGLTVHLCSVKTQPTAGDYVAALAGVLSGSLLGWLGGKITGKGLPGKLRKFLFELVLRMLDLDDVLDELPDPQKVHNLVQRWIDDGFDEAKKQWQEEVKKSQEDRREKKAEEDGDWTKRLEFLLKKLGFKKTRWANKGK